MRKIRKMRNNKDKQSHNTQRYKWFSLTNLHSPVKMTWRKYIIKIWIQDSKEKKHSKPKAPIHPIISQQVVSEPLLTSWDGCLNASGLDIIKIWVQDSKEKKHSKPKAPIHPIIFQQVVLEPWLTSWDGCLNASGLELCLHPQLLTQNTLKNVKRLTSEGELGQYEETHKW